MRRLLLAVLCVLAVASCGEPPSREYYIHSDGTGEYSFDVAFGDSLGVYDLSLYASIAAPVFVKDTLQSFPLQLVWRSPSGRYFSETVYYPASEAVVPYRSGVTPSEPGLWNISVTVFLEDRRRLRGLGLRVVRR